MIFFQVYSIAADIHCSLIYYNYYWCFIYMYLLYLPVIKVCYICTSISTKLPLPASISNLILLPCTCDDRLKVLPQTPPNFSWSWCRFCDTLTSNNCGPSTRKGLGVQRGETCMILIELNYSVINYPDLLNKMGFNFTLNAL